MVEAEMEVMHLQAKEHQGSRHQGKRGGRPGAVSEPAEELPAYVCTVDCGL